MTDFYSDGEVTLSLRCRYFERVVSPFTRDCGRIQSGGKNRRVRGPRGEEIGRIGAKGETGRNSSTPGNGLYGASRRNLDARKRSLLRF